MGCILVRPIVTADDGEDQRGGANVEPSHQQVDCNNFFERIIAAATNTSLFKPNDSDVHAEINAIGQVAKRTHASSLFNSAERNTTQGAIAYITMPPCRRCFGALYASDISRIVSRVEHPSILRTAAQEVGIDMVCLTPQQLADQRVRMDLLFARRNTDGDESFFSKCTTDAANHTDDDPILNQHKEGKEAKRPRNMLSTNGK